MQEDHTSYPASHWPDIGIRAFFRLAGRAKERQESQCREGPLRGVECDDLLTHGQKGSKISLKYKKKKDDDAKINANGITVALNLLFFGFNMRNICIAVAQAFMDARNAKLTFLSSIVRKKSVIVHVCRREQRLICCSVSFGETEASTASYVEAEFEEEVFNERFCQGIDARTLEI
jgi:hypothetical protein